MALLFCLLLALGLSTASAHYCQPLYLQVSNNNTGLVASGSGFPSRCKQNYNDRTDCSYTLIEGHYNTGGGVDLNFEWFNTESCCDKVFVTYVNHAGQQVQGFFSGSLGRFNMTLPARRGTPVAMRFYTDGSVVSSGFLLRFGPHKRSNAFHLDATVNVDSSGRAHGEFDFRPVRRHA